eukprot:563570-Amphidinium_carterae.1
MPGGKEFSRRLVSDWHIQHGKLPMNITQLYEYGPIMCVCVLCGSTAVNAVRKRYIGTHIKCLEKITTRDPIDPATVDTDIPQISTGQKRREGSGAAATTLLAGKAQALIALPLLLNLPVCS